MLLVSRYTSFRYRLQMSHLPPTESTGRDSALGFGRPLLALPSGKLLTRAPRRSCQQRLRRRKPAGSSATAPRIISGNEPGSGTPTPWVPPLLPPCLSPLLHAAICLSSASPSHFGRG